MEIDVKYKLYQKVWIMYENRPTEISLKALRIKCEYNGYSGEYWGDERAGKGRGWPMIILYNTEGSRETNWINQDLVFTTKEELLKSL